MLHLPIYRINRQYFDRGFTLIEMLMIVIIISIMCALATPSLLAIQGVTKLNSSADNIRTALETSQFQATKKKRSCNVYIRSNGETIVGDCMINGVSSNTDIANGPDRLPVLYLASGITVTTVSLTGTPPQVVYNRDGLTQNSGTIILSSTETSDKRCLVLNKGVGLIRSGKYISTCQVTE
jgi:prepilin-type N-terminal cleavage/methylation domain-containing protein